MYIPCCCFCPTVYIVCLGVFSIFVCVMVLIGILWIPVIQGMQGAQLYFYIQAVSAYLAPPIASVYLLAVLWRRANERVTMSLSIKLTLTWLERSIHDITVSNEVRSAAVNKPVGVEFNAIKECFLYSLFSYD